jgi:hypothetical protein
MKDIKEIKINWSFIYTKEYLVESKLLKHFIWHDFQSDFICKLSKNEFENFLITGKLNKNNDIGIYCWEYLDNNRLKDIKNDEILIKFSLFDFYNNELWKTIIKRFQETEEKIKSDYWDYDYDLNLVLNNDYLDKFDIVDFILETDEKLEYFKNLIDEKF